MNELKNLIEKYEKLLDLKETSQKITQEEAKNYNNSCDYNDEQKRMNTKLNLVKLSSEIKTIKMILQDLEESKNKQRKEGFIFVVECGEYSGTSIEIYTDINLAIEKIHGHQYEYHDICAWKCNEYFLLYQSDGTGEEIDKDTMKEKIIKNLNELLEEKS